MNRVDTSGGANRQIFFQGNLVNLMSTLRCPTERTGLPSRLTAMMSSLTRVTHTEVMADDDVRKFDAKRTVLARGLPLATSTAKVRALPSSSHPGRSSRARSLNSLGRSADF